MATAIRPDLGDGWDMHDSRLDWASSVLRRRPPWPLAKAVSAQVGCRIKDVGRHVWPQGATPLHSRHERPVGKVTMQPAFITSRL